MPPSSSKRSSPRDRGEIVDSDGKDNDEYAGRRSRDAKRLRFSQPDVKIVVKYEDDNGATQTKSYSQYAQFLAKHSKFVDTSLSVRMKEKRTRVITLQDVTPAMFENAMKYLDDPSHVRSMTHEDALQLAEFYDQYEFTAGIKLCDTVLSEWFESFIAAAKDKGEPPTDLNLVVNTLTMAHRLNMPEALERGAKYITQRLHDYNPQTPNRIGPTMFSLQHIRDLQPLFVSKEVLSPLTMHMSREKLECDLFPEYFVNKASLRNAHHMLQTLLVRGTKCHADGKFDLAPLAPPNRLANNLKQEDPTHFVRYKTKRKATMPDGIGQITFQIQKVEMRQWNWALVGKRCAPTTNPNLPPQQQPGSKVVLWEVPLSANLVYPPKDGWVAVHPQAKDSVPMIRYLSADDSPPEIKTTVNKKHRKTKKSNNSSAN